MQLTKDSMLNKTGIITVLLLTCNNYSQQDMHYYDQAAESVSPIFKKIIAHNRFMVPCLVVGYSAYMTYLYKKYQRRLDRVQQEADRLEHIPGNQAQVQNIRDILRAAPRPGNCKGIVLATGIVSLLLFILFYTAKKLNKMSLSWKTLATHATCNSLIALWPLFAFNYIVNLRYHSEKALEAANLPID